MRKRPWFKFEARAWLSNPDLRQCDLAARGLLADIMALAHGGTPYGYVSARGWDTRRPDFVRNAARALQVSPRSFRKSFQNLTDFGRIATDDCGKIYVPRMVKDHAYALQQSGFGKTGGNPTLKGAVKAGVKVEKEKEKEKETDTDTRVRAKPSADLDLFGLYAWLSAQPEWTGLEIEDWRLCTSRRNPHINWHAAVVHIADRAQLEGTLHKPAVFLDTQLGYWEADHADDISRAGKAARARGKHARELAAFIAEGGNGPGSVERMAADYARQYGPAVVERARALAGGAS